MVAFSLNLPASILFAAKASMSDFFTRMVNTVPRRSRTSARLVFPPTAAGGPKTVTATESAGLMLRMFVASFMALPFVIAGTDRVGLMQRRLADRLAGSADVRVLPCPFEPVPIVEALWWHPMYDRDPAHSWLRDTVAEAGTLLSAMDPHKPR